MTHDASRSDLLHIAWHGAELGYLLDDNQLQWLHKYESTTGSLVLCVSRRVGKSYFLCTLALMQALSAPRQYIKYAAPTGKAAREIITPLIEQLLTECPPQLRPKYDGQRNVWLFPNGSMVTVAGCDSGHYDALRGQAAHLCIVDEAGYVDELNKVEEVLLPQLLTTGGRLVYASTPPESLAHPFVARYASAQAHGRAIHATLAQHARLSDAAIQAFAMSDAERLGLTYEEYLASTYYRREFLAEFVADESRAAIPAWAIETVRKDAVVDVPRPTYFDGYVALDLGFGDPHAALWAWWDYPSQTLHIERELVMHGATLAALSEECKAVELELYGTTRWTGTLRAQLDTAQWPQYLLPAYDATCPQQPYLRVADNAPLSLAELAEQHQIAFVGTRKDDKHLAIDAVNIALRRGQIKVATRCTKLQTQLASVTWNKQRTEWQRTPDGHGDLIDALVYLWRNVAKHKDPRPQQRDAFFDAVRGDKEGEAWAQISGKLRR